MAAPFLLDIIMILGKICNAITHNPVSSRVRQALFGWSCVERHGYRIWYKKIRIYPGYGEYDYEQMFEKAVRFARSAKKGYKDRRIVAEVAAYYSGGRPGIGSRRVEYVIKPYGKVF